MTGYIEIERLQLNGRHGVLPQERVVGNRFELWITLRYDMSQAAQSDSIDCAVNYAEAVEIAKKYETPETVKFMNGILGSFVRQEISQ